MKQTKPTTLGPSHVVHLADMPAHKNPNGSESRNTLRGATLTGDNVSLHESTQPQGLAPNPAHAINHTELICIRQGTLEFKHDNITETATAGDILFVAKGTNHQLRNIGEGPVDYFVVAIGGDAIH